MICAVMKVLVVNFFSKSTHWQSDRDQSHFSKFVTKCSSLSNAFATNV